MKWWLFVLALSVALVARADLPEPVASAITLFVKDATRLSDDKIRVTFSPWRQKLTPCTVPLEVSSTNRQILGPVLFRVRCASPVWQTAVQATVALQTDYWQADRYLPAGTVLAESDARPAQGDLARLPPDIAGKASQWVGRVLSRPLPAGTPIALNTLRENTVVKAGERIRVMIIGAGYQVTGEATALAPAGVGDLVKIKMPDGQQASARVVKAGMVELHLE